MSRGFSDRHGYSEHIPEITIREEAPDDLRYAVVQIAKSAGKGGVGHLKRLFKCLPSL
jgi:hypothetical protein